MMIDSSLLGLTRDQVLEKLGQPDYRGNFSKKYPIPTIWVYGYWEIAFDKNSGLVSSIFDDPEKKS